MFLIVHQRRDDASLLRLYAMDVSPFCDGLRRGHRLRPRVTGALPVVVHQSATILLSGHASLKKLRVVQLIVHSEDEIEVVRVLVLPNSEIFLLPVMKMPRKSICGKGAWGC